MKRVRDVLMRIGECVRCSTDLFDVLNAVLLLKVSFNILFGSFVGSPDFRA